MTLNPNAAAYQPRHTNYPYPQSNTLTIASLNSNGNIYQPYGHSYFHQTQYNVSANMPPNYYGSNNNVYNTNNNPYSINSNVPSVYAQDLVSNLNYSQQQINQQIDGSFRSNLPIKPDKSLPNNPVSTIFYGNLRKKIKIKTQKQQSVQPHFSSMDNKNIYKTSKLYLLISGYSRNAERMINRSFKLIISSDVINLFFKYYGIYKYRNSMIIGFVTNKPANRYKHFDVVDFVTKKTIQYKPITGKSYSDHETYYNLQCIGRNITLSSKIINLWNDNNPQNKIYELDTCNPYNAIFVDSVGMHNGKTNSVILFDEHRAFQLDLPAFFYYGDNGTVDRRYIYSSRYGLLVLDYSIFSFCLNEWKWNMLTETNPKFVLDKASIVLIDNDTKVFMTRSPTRRRKRVTYQSKCCIYNLNDLTLSYTSHPSPLGSNPAICSDDTLHKRVYIYQKELIGIAHRTEMFTKGRYYDIGKDNWCKLPTMQGIYKDAFIWVDDVNKNLLYACSWTSNCIQMLDIRTNQWTTINDDLDKLFGGHYDLPLFKI